MKVNKIYNEESSEGMKRLPDDSVDMTITSPPYDNLRKYNGYNFDCESTIDELYRVTKDGGVVVWIVGDATINGSETGTSFRQALSFMEKGFKLHDTMIYMKNNPTPIKSKRYQPSFEYMFVFVKGKIKTFNPIMVEKKYIENRKIKHYNKDKEGRQISHEYKSKSNMKVKTNVWNYSVGLHHSSSDKIAFQHPAIFPEQLVKDHIMSWSNENDIILDPFMGSGTTAVACIDTNRNYIGFEISKEYCDIAAVRIENKLNKILTREGVSDESY